MPDTQTGSAAGIPAGIIAGVASDGNLTLALSENQPAEVGDRFNVADAQGKLVAEITIIQTDKGSGVIARPFKPLVPPDVLSSATGGVVVGGVIGSILTPAIGSVIGAAIGAAVVGTRMRRKNSPGIGVGMKIFSASTDSPTEG
jgi:hypothetical protein